MAEFAAEGGDVNVDGAVRNVGAALGGFGEELFAAENAAAGAHESEEHVELDGGEVDAGAVAAGDALMGVDGDADGFEEGTTGGGAGAADEGVETGEEFAVGEGLGDVVVGAAVEAGDAFLFAATGGEHHDGDVAAGADAAEDFEAVDAGEHDVEDDDVDAGAEGFDGAFGAGVDGGDLIAVGGEVFGQQLADEAIVLNDQGSNGRCHAASG